MRTSLYNDISDFDLIILLKDGNNDAYKEIYKRYHTALFIHAFKRLQDKEECRDIIQNLFINLWQKREQLVVNDSLSGYLYTSVRYAVFNFLAKSKLKEEYKISIEKYAVSYDASTDFLIRQKQLIRIIEKEISCLPDRTREIFKLSRFDNLTHKEIAQKLDISEQTVKTTVNNALKTLRIRLGSLFFILF